MSDYASWELGEGEALAPGRIVIDSIGGGSRYEVFLVWDEDLFALAVAKVLRPDQVADERALRDLRHEWDALSGLAHPVLIRGFDAVLEGGRPHLLIEHLEGPSLRRLIRRGGPMPEQQVLPVALSVAGALAYLARREIAHLDVKPDNIIMGVPPRLIDLSIARSLDRAARSRGPLGTDAYMAPEQSGADDLVPYRMGAAADVWGLGATLHHCLGGHRPFPRGDDAHKSPDPRIRFPQLESPPRALPDYVDRRFRELIESMLRFNPADRPPAAEIAEQLEPLVAALPKRLVLSRRGAMGLG